MSLKHIIKPSYLIGILIFIALVSWFKPSEGFRIFTGDADDGSPSAYQLQTLAPKDLEYKCHQLRQEDVCKQSRFCVWLDNTCVSGIHNTKDARSFNNYTSKLEDNQNSSNHAYFYKDGRCYGNCFGTLVSYPETDPIDSIALPSPTAPSMLGPSMNMPLAYSDFMNGPPSQPHQLNPNHNNFSALQQAELPNPTPSDTTDPNMLATPLPTP